MFWPDDGPCWGRNWSKLNNHNHKNVLVVAGDLLDLCDWYSNGDFPYKFSKLSCETLRSRRLPAGRFIVYQSNTNYTVAV